MQIQGDGLEATVSGEQAIAALSGIILERIRERERTKRLLIVVTFILLVIAALVPLFAPDGKEVNSYISSAALVIMALGAIGATKFAVRAPGVEVDSEAAQFAKLVKE